jgi:hypothetical protein
MGLSFISHRAHGGHGAVVGWGNRSITAYAICRFIARRETEGTEPTHPPPTSFHDYGRGISLGLLWDCQLFRTGHTEGTEPLLLIEAVD